ncbi:PREDICTED: F-box/kelch-repeat [Prunus dulcis]|uniref:PREDICTED: F-box/kelch-repeat n=1 Tax=Prunus dulcis TaxID=3755 RepID=A0A5E4FI10_PRUDU|nr:PREDICTED: F-box/kelch-repeat [Prunus dulcis]
MANLSEDIIADILSQLPVKSVGRFRCVSKSRLHLTTQPHFIQTHLNRTQTQKLILSSHSLFSLDHLATIDDDMLPLELDFPLNTHLKTKWVLVSGSYNGLVCIMPQPEAFFIFNPSTRESMRVPDCPMPSHACPQQGVRFHRHAHDFGHAHGFGHAPPMSDYKVQDFPYKHLLDVYGKFLNGAVHWLCGPLGVGGPCVITAFDLAEEKFSDLATPDSVTSYQRFITGILEGCLCLLHYHDDHKQHSFWVMKEYNVKESWTKIMITNSCFSLQPLCYWKNTNILLVRNQKQLLMCNRKDGTCKKFLVNGLPSDFNADVYVESLISPNFQQN